MGGIGFKKLIPGYNFVEKAPDLINGKNFHCLI